MTSSTLSTIAVIGAGTMGHGIAHVCAAAGYQARLLDVRRELVDAGLAMRAPKLWICASVSGEISRPTTISSSFIRCTGLKSGYR